MTGMTRREALALSNEGGGVTIRFVRQPAAAGEEPGTVVAQTPAPLEPIEIGGVVTAILAEQREHRDRAAGAEHELRPGHRRAGHHPPAGAEVPRDRGRRRRRSAAAGTVIDQDPRPNEQAAAGSTVTIVVTGAYTDGIEVPDVEGVPLQQAKQKLEAAGLGVRARRDVGAPRADDVVFTSDPARATSSRRDTVVWLTTDPRSVASAAAAPKRELATTGRPRPISDLRRSLTTGETSYEDVSEPCPAATKERRGCHPGARSDCCRRARAERRGPFGA